ncbi:hypothetical protein ACH4FX_10980 [Streptomyces sp. NPDC018019]|uniref:hypothetical protein n=1 Tax=Streptomyces sp. NPDC018019 TaxID=3365030 RepID=UPI0037AE25D0
MKAYGKLALAAGTVAMGVTGVLSAAPATAAAPAKASTTATAACSNPLHVYESINYRGAWQKLCRTDRDLGDNKWHNSRKSLDNSISSIKNVDRCTWNVYAWGGYIGNYKTFRPGKKDPDLRNNNVGNDTITSAKKSC